LSVNVCVAAPTVDPIPPQFELFIQGLRAAVLLPLHNATLANSTAPFNAPPALQVQHPTFQVTLLIVTAKLTPVVPVLKAFANCCTFTASVIPV